jgi:hypothetical protein
MMGNTEKAEAIVRSGLSVYISNKYTAAAAALILPPPMLALVHFQMKQSDMHRASGKRIRLSVWLDRGEKAVTVNPENLIF